MKEQRYFSHALSGLITIFFVVFSIGLIYAQFAGGQGTEDDPWQIARDGDLDRIRQYLGNEHADKHYIQTHDIDLGRAPWNEDEGWVPVAPSGDDTFQGTYNGNGFEIQNLTINRNASNQSLFGVTDGAVIKNIKLVNIDIRSMGWGNIAALVGSPREETLIKNCSATGTIVGATEGNSGWQLGGLVGTAVNSTIKNCFADVNVTGRTRTGGLVAWANATDVINCFSLGEVNNSAQVAGGLVGLLMTHGAGQGNGSVTNSYAMGNVTVGMNQGGGLIGTIGNASVTYCYAAGQVTGTGGGLVGQSNTQDTVSDSYWDTETTGKDESAGGGAGRLTRQMIYPYDLNEAFIRWDFDEIWVQDSTFENEVNPGVNNGYPFLFYQEPDEPDLLDTPEIISISIREEEGFDTVYIRWEAVDEANSYKIFSADSPNPEDDEWGEPIGWTGQTEFSQEIEGRSRYFFITASPEEAP